MTARIEDMGGSGTVAYGRLKSESNRHESAFLSAEGTGSRRRSDKKRLASQVRTTLACVCNLLYHFATQQLRSIQSNLKREREIAESGEIQQCVW